MPLRRRESSPRPFSTSAARARRSATVKTASVRRISTTSRPRARYAPATALFINMHNYWVGDAADLWRAGDNAARLEGQQHQGDVGRHGDARDAERRHDPRRRLHSRQVRRARRSGGCRARSASSTALSTSRAASACSRRASSSGSPRLPGGPLPSDELGAHARHRRQDHARNQSGRAAALGLRRSDSRVEPAPCLRGPPGVRESSCRRPCRGRRSSCSPSRRSRRSSGCRSRPRRT